MRYNNHWSAIVAFAILVGALVAFLPALVAYRQIQHADNCGNDMLQKGDVGFIYTMFLFARALR